MLRWLLIFSFFAGVLHADLPPKKLSLEEAIAIALDQNPNKKAAEQGIYIAENQIVESFSAYYPDIDFIGSYFRFRERIFLPTFTLPFPTPILTNPIVGPTNDINIRIEGSYILYDSGNRLAKLRASRANSQIAKEEADRVTNEIVLNVCQSYYSTLSDIDLYEVALANRARSEDHLRIVQDRYEVRDVPLADLFRIQTEVAESRQTVVRTKSLVRISKGNLNVVMGLSPDVDYELSKVYTTPEDPSALCLQQSFENALLYRPEIRSQSYRIDVKANAIDEAKSAFGPKVVAGGKVGRRDVDFFPKDTEWALGVTLTVPLCKGFRDIANYRKAQGEYYQEIAGYDSVSLLVRQDVWNAYSRIMESFEAIKTAKSQVKDATESMRLAKERYLVGAATITDLLDAQTALLQAEATDVDAYHNYQVALATYQWAQGILR